MKIETLEQKRKHRKMVCSEPHCEMPEAARGLCGKHYKVRSREGALPERLTPSQRALAKFWLYVDKQTDCWVWTGSVNTYGYGQYSVDGKNRKSHRIAYESLVGPIPEGLVLDHLCRVRRCVNPSHLEAVTDKENVLRGEGVTARNAAKTHCKNGHLFDEENTRIEKRGSRLCRTCRNDYLKKWRRSRARRKGEHQ